MARIGRVVVEDYPHHIIQRGNRRQPVFFQECDYEKYLELLRKNCLKYNTRIVTYCLMPNHIHLIAIPGKKGNLAKAIGETHRSYTRYINFRENWRGYLWQGRFSSYILDEKYLLSAVRYILNNPVKAKLVKNAWQYAWSSAREHIKGKGNKLVEDSLLKGLVDNWKDFLSTDLNREEMGRLQTHERTGRPLGSEEFIGQLEKIVNRDLKKRKPGPKKKQVYN